MSELKEKYIQFCCDFYNEHAPKDKLWFGRMYDECLQEHNKRNSTMYQWQFPLMILKDQEAKIEKLENELSTTKQVLGNVIDMEVAKVDDLKTQLNNMEACYIQMKKDKAELLGVISDALEAFNDGEFNYCQKQLEMHAKPLRGDCE